MLFLYCVCHAFASAYCCLVVTCWKRADLLALLFVVLNCVIVSFPFGILGQVCIGSCLCPLSYFHTVRLALQIPAVLIQ